MCNMNVVLGQATRDTWKCGLKNPISSVQMILHCDEHALFITFYCTIRNLKFEQHVMFIFCMKLANNSVETYEMLGTAYGDKALSWAQTF